MNGLESMLEADAGDVDGDVRGGDNLDGELEVLNLVVGLPMNTTLLTISFAP